MKASIRNRAAVFAALFAVLFAGLALSACGGDDSSDASSDTTTKASAASTEGVEVKLGVLQGATLAAVAQKIGSIDDALAAEGATASYEGPFPAMVPAIEAMNAGDVDITYGSISAAIGALAGNSDFKVMAIEPVQPDNEGIIVAGDSGIETVQDLKGKKIAINKAGTGEYLARLALDKAGLTPDDVEFVDLAPPDAASAFGSGQVDAWATWSAFTGLAQDELGGKMLITGGELGSLNDTPYIVDSGFAEEYPTLVAAVYKGLNDAATWVQENPKDAIAFYVESGLPPSVAKTQAASGQPVEAITGQDQIDRFQEVSKYVADQGVIPEEVDMSDRTVNVEESGS